MDFIQLVVRSALNRGEEGPGGKASRQCLEQRFCVSCALPLIYFKKTQCLFLHGSAKHCKDLPDDVDLRKCHVVPVHCEEKSQHTGHAPLGVLDGHVPRFYSGPEVLLPTCQGRWLFLLFVCSGEQETSSGSPLTSLLVTRTCAFLSWFSLL